MAYESPLLIGHQGNLWTGDNAADAAADRAFWAQVTDGPAGAFYGWQEVLPLPTAAFVPREGGRTGTVSQNPAYEPNGGALALYSYVLLRRAYYDPAADWVYAVSYEQQTAGTSTTTVVSGGSSGVEIKDQTGTPDVVGATVLIVNSASAGFSATALHLTNPSGTQAQVAAYYATASQDGVVSTTTQTFAGNKSLTGSFTATGEIYSQVGLLTSFKVSTGAGNIGCFGAYGVGFGVALEAQNGGSTTVTDLAVIPPSAGAGEVRAACINGGVHKNTFYSVVDSTNTVRSGVYGTTTEGDTISGGLVTGVGVSDARLKRPRDTALNALGVVGSVRPTYFRWDRERCKEFGVAHDDALHYGFLAQDLAAAFPQAVRENDGPGGKRLTLDLVAVVAVLWQAVRELVGESRAEGG